ncbi:MAG TPA: ricin-type beta-trefoil lectin domain protein [Terracidiphilus sp.]
MFRLIRTGVVVCAFSLTIGLSQLVAQGGACRDPWINSAYNQIFHRAPQGSGTVGECNISLYGGGRWSNYQDLYNKVLGSKYCQDPWIGEAYVLAIHRRPAGNECSPVNYGGGRWSGFDDLVAKVQQYQAQLASRRYSPPPPAPVYSRPVARAVARPVTIISQLGSKCLDAEGGRSAQGVRLIGYPCNAQGNQEFLFNANGTITQNGLCVDAAGGLGRAGDQIQLWSCNGGANQRWRVVNDQLVGMNNRCIDLKNGQGWWGLGNQPAILWDCNGQVNQHWLAGVTVPSSRVRGARTVPPGALVPMRGINGAGVIPAGAGNVITAGGGNVIAAGGGNVIAAGGGNVIAAGGGNVIVPSASFAEAESGGGDEGGVQQ